MNTNTNLILMTDSYKASHYCQYPPHSERVSSYIEARRNAAYSHALFFGLQAFIKGYLMQPISQADINDAEAVLTAHGEPFNRAGWLHILNQHGGYLPLTIEALPEGVVVPTGTALVQVVNTDTQVPWLTSYLETALLRAIWYPTTVATTSWRIKQRLIQAWQQTSTAPIEQLSFKLHDFGARGVSSAESAALGGMAHLVNFQGTDTLEGLLAARRFYHEPLAGYSIPAAEHSTITCWGKDREAEAYANMLTQFAKPGQFLAVVSDSYDIYHAVSEIWGKQMKSRIIESGATLVIRPDSGIPQQIVVEVLERLYAAFGGTINQKGYKVLAPAVRVIQGDGINETAISLILSHMQQAGFAVDNIAFGMGGALLQHSNRDTLSFAMKASAIQIQGQWQPVYKAPVTDPDKHSKQGRQVVLQTETGEWITLPLAQCPADAHNQLQPVYQDGQLLVEWDFATIRQRAQTA